MFDVFHTWLLVLKLLLRIIGLFLGMLVCLPLLFFIPELCIHFKMKAEDFVRDAEQTADIIRRKEKING